jgi:hypothetical protein
MLHEALIGDKAMDDEELASFPSDMRGDMIDEEEGRRPSVEVQINIETVEERRRSLVLLGEKSDNILSRHVNGLLPFKRLVKQLSICMEDCRYGVVTHRIEIDILWFLDRVGRLRKHIKDDQELQTQLQWLDLIKNKRWRLEEEDLVSQVWAGMEKYANRTEVETEATFEEDCRQVAYFLTGVTCESEYLWHVAEWKY